MTIARQNYVPLNHQHPLNHQQESSSKKYENRGVEFTQRLVRRAWGGLDFHVRDLDGNAIAFVQFRHPDSAAE